MALVDLHINTWIITLFLSGCFLLIFTLAEIMYHRFRVKAELTRKFVHFTSGILTLTFPLWLDSHWQALVLCASFALLLLISLWFDFLKSINAVDRITWGSYLFPVSVYLCFHAWLSAENLFFFYAPMTVLAISDPMAALFGKRWPRGKYRVLKETKTLVGSTAFFITAYAVLFGMMCIFMPESKLSIIAFASLVTALAATISEAVSQKGTDNLLIPLSILAIFYFG